MEPQKTTQETPQDTWKPTATLTGVRVLLGEKGVYIRGIIRGDTRKRFDDGELIRTSYVLEVRPGMIRTANSIYAIGGVA